jgi:DNA-binding SARP family transcriptional activator
VTLDLRVLGPLDARIGGASVPLGSPKQRALLVHLVLHANEGVSIERLIDQLWPEDPPATARHAIQVYVSALRKALRDPGRIMARPRSRAAGGTLSRLASMLDSISVWSTGDLS